MWSVSIHAPAWGATDGQMFAGVDARIVSIHAPAWGATPRSSAPCCCPWRFNPRARVGRDRECSLIGRVALVVSIHAPAWGATIARVMRGNPLLSVSIHAPAWGATCVGCAGLLHRGRFNPRARVGRDLHTTYKSHAFCIQFQSTRPRGARPDATSPTPPAAPFQSTRPRGARRLR